MQSVHAHIGMRCCVGTQNSFGLLSCPPPHWSNRFGFPQSALEDGATACFSPDPFVSGRRERLNVDERDILPCQDSAPAPAQYQQHIQSHEATRSNRECSFRKPYRTGSKMTDTARHKSREGICTDCQGSAEFSSGRTAVLCRYLSQESHIDRS